MKQNPTHIAVQSNIPIPANRSYRSKWPFASMKVGDSFFVKQDDPNFMSVRMAGTNFSKTNKEYKFTSRKENGGLRIWRIPTNDK